MTINDNDIDIEYEPIEDKEKTIAEICKAASIADEIYLAPDPDREGEIIAWHVEQEILKVIKKKQKCIVLPLTKLPKLPYKKQLHTRMKLILIKVAAQQARRVLDRWVGYEVSPILWIKIASGLSAGRVQSVALRLICDREEAIRNFKPEEYWTITGHLSMLMVKLKQHLPKSAKKKLKLQQRKS